MSENDDDDASQVKRLRLRERGLRSGLSSQEAQSDAHLRQLIDRLDRAGDYEAADTIAWLIERRDFYMRRMYAHIEEAYGPPRAGVRAADRRS